MLREHEAAISENKIFKLKCLERKEKIEFALPL